MKRVVLQPTGPIIRLAAESDIRRTRTTWLVWETYLDLNGEFQLSSAVRRIIWWVFTGSRGGPNRARLVTALKEKPMNANQIAAHLGMDYKTVRHHLNVLVKNHMLISVGEEYGAMYFISPELEENYDEFIRIWEKIGQQYNRSTP
jgi:DNA-binding transcriptional ArsR family regulator